MTSKLSRIWSKKVVIISPANKVFSRDLTHDWLISWFEKSFSERRKFQVQLAFVTMLGNFMYLLFIGL